ncbi:hypothetical protein RHSIM_Rhsim09G0155500 [Rhododendron simsii]|uniref:Ribosomal RNA-processing protein 43 n=1 Tax=Rhododendron simsii TaxID=118357 RepID=A0A834GIA8_RHOSS|nr:hypothetical protein RHSIM_Rhsim09G0155500 [Rhododendron simsii]
MSSATMTSDLSSEMEVDAFRRLFPLRFHERHLQESIRPDARPLGKARDTSVALGAVASADGSALAKIGCTTMLAAIKMEVMTPTTESADEGCIAIDFHMPPICSPIVRPGRPAEAAPVISKQLSDTILRHVKVFSAKLFSFACVEALLSSNLAERSVLVVLQCPRYYNGLKLHELSQQLLVLSASSVNNSLLASQNHSGMINLKELSLVSGKAAWMAYLDIYCLDADGALFDAALLSAVAAFSHLQIPVVSLNDDGRVVVVSNEEGEKLEKEPVNKEKRKLKLSSIPFSLTCVLHKNYILADPTAEEESVMETLLTVVLDSSFQLVSLYKPGGPVLAHTSVIQDCVALTRQRLKELQKILNEAVSDMEVD